MTGLFFHLVCMSRRLSDKKLKPLRLLYEAIKKIAQTLRVITYSLVFDEGNWLPMLTWRCSFRLFQARYRNRNGLLSNCWKG